MATKRKIEAPAASSALSLALDLSPDPEHAKEVCANALALFDGLRTMHGLGEDARALLEAAAFLHDIGQSKSMAGHHKHSRDLILKASLPGVTEEERRIIACVARYHRKSEPSPTHKIYRDLPPDAQALVCKLAGMLRIADGLDRSHHSATSRLEVRRKYRAVLIRVHQRETSPSDIWGAMRKRGLFETAFNVHVDIVCA